MATSHPQHPLAQRFAALAQQTGIGIAQVKLLGSYLHIDYTRAADEPRLLEMLSAMKPARVARLPGDVCGVHLDSSKAHRIVAVFGATA